MIRLKPIPVSFSEMGIFEYVVNGKWPIRTDSMRHVCLIVAQSVDEPVSPCKWQTTSSFLFLHSPKVERGSFISSSSSGGGWALKLSTLLAFIATASSSGIDSLLELEDSLGGFDDLAVFISRAAAEFREMVFSGLLVCSSIWKETGFCWESFRCLMAFSDTGSEEARFFLIFCSFSLR